MSYQSASIEALSPVFGVDPQGDRFCVTPQGERNLVRICNRLADGPHLVGLYAVENAESYYNPDPAQYGRVIALVRVLPMPPGCTVRSFPSGCLELRGSSVVDRWPAGWPSTTVFFSPHGGPMLRDAAYAALGVTDYAGFAGQFLQGPIDLRPMPALRRWLMAEVLHQISRNPATLLRPF